MNLVKSPSAIYAGVVAGDTRCSELPNQSVFNRGVVRCDKLVTEQHDIGPRQALQRITQAHLVKRYHKLLPGFVPSLPISLRSVGVIPCIPYVMSSSHHRYRGTGQQQTQRDLCDANANEPGRHQHSEPKGPSRPLRPWLAVTGRLRARAHDLSRDFLIIFTSIGLAHALIVNSQCRVLIFFAGNAVAGDQKLDIGSHKAAERVFRAADDRLAPDIEAGVD